MRIGVFHDDCGDPGGANTCRKRLSALLAERGHEIYLFTFRGESGGNADPHSTVFTPGGSRRTGGRFAHHNIPNYPVFRAFRDWLKTVSPDILHIHTNYAFASSILLACRGVVPAVQTVHDFRLVCPTERGVTPSGRLCGGGASPACAKDGCVTWKRYAFEIAMRQIRRPLFHSALHCLIAPSRALHQALEREGLRAVHIPHFADISAFPYASVDKRSDTALFVGYLHFSKGVGLLLKAFPRVLEAVPTARLLIAGDGPMMAELRSQHRGHGLGEEVTFLGTVPEGEVKKLYQRSLFLILPSIIYENSPLTIYEAMASGRAVVGTRIGGIPELVMDGETGLLFERNNDIDLADKIVALLKDKGRTERMGTVARRRAESLFTVEGHISAILETYESARRAFR